MGMSWNQKLSHTLTYFLQLVFYLNALTIKCFEPHFEKKSDKEYVQKSFEKKIQKSTYH